VRALRHDHQPPSQHGPVGWFVGDGGLAVDADVLPAGGALTEDVERVGARIDHLPEPLAEFTERIVLDGADENASLDAVAVGLKEGGDVGAAVVLADVVGDDVG